MTQFFGKSRLVLLLIVMISTIASAEYRTKIAMLSADNNTVVVEDCSLSATVFDQRKLRTYYLDIDSSDWVWLQGNVIKEEYVPAKLMVDGDTIGTVGVRFKGSTFTLEGCTGKRDGVICDKISMKIKFNEYEKALRFHGLKRLNFNSMMYDASSLHERISYSVFAEMGVITSRASHARLVINGEYRGLFSLVEQIDDVFIKNRFPHVASGNLFKERWPVTGDSLFYANGLKTNKEAADVSAFVGLYKELQKTEDTDLISLVKKYHNDDYLLRYMAVDRAISNWDGITAFYPEKEVPGTFASHNYYWYQIPGKEFFWILPWDLDGTMTLETGFDHVPAWNEKVEDTAKKYSIFNGETFAKAPYADKFMRGWGMIGNENKHYKKYQQMVLDGPFKEGVLEARIDQWTKLLEEAVNLDQYGPALPVWQNAVADIKTNVSLLRTRLASRIADKKMTPYLYRYDKKNNFEKVDAYNYRMGSYKYSNMKSCIRVSLNEDEPLAGKRDIRIDFDMYNEINDPEKGAFYQWVWHGAYFDEEKEPTDFVAKGIVGVEFIVRSDKKRKLLTCVSSSVFEKDNKDCYWGWYSDVDTKPKKMKLYFKDGQFPKWMDKPESYDIQKILQQVTAFSISPVVEGLQENGIFKEGDHDKGFLQIDNIRFLRK